MSDPAEDVPADRPTRRCDAGLRFGALGLGVAGAVTIGAMVEFADQLHRPFESMKAAVAMVTDVHQPPAARAGAVDDVEFPEGEIRIRRPSVGHPADLHILVRSIECGSAIRGYTKKPRVSSPLSGRCILSMGRDCAP